MAVAVAAAAAVVAAAVVGVLVRRVVAWVRISRRIRCRGRRSSCSNGCAVVGETLGVSTGTWSNSPTSYTYQWDRCATTSAQPPTTGSCTAIAGATSPTYTVQSADSGHSLVPIVTATNASGSASTNITSGSCDTGEMLGETEGSAYATTSAVPTAQPAGCSPISAVVATTAAAETFCTNAVTTCGYADPLNHTVGVPAGVTLRLPARAPHTPTAGRSRAARSRSTAA